MSETETIVIVGGGLAAGKLATEYRAAGGEADVTILGAEPDPPYSRPPLTKGFLRGELDRDAPLVRPEAEYEEDVIELRLDTTVEKIDADAHEVELAGGERVPYGALVVATAHARGRCRSPEATSSESTPTARSWTPRPSATRRRRRTPRSWSAGASSAPRAQPPCACADSP